MEKKQNIQFIIFGLMGLTVLTIASISFIMLFQKIQILTLQGETASNELQMFANQNQQVQQMQRTVRETKVQRKTLTGYFIHESDLAQFLGKIEQLKTMTGANIQIKAVAAGTPIGKDKSLSPLTITIGDSGKFVQVVHTLVILESLPWVSSIVESTMTQDPLTKVWVGKFQLQIMKLNTKVNNK